MSIASNELAVSSTSPPGRVLAVDLGEVRVGIALSDSQRRLAHGETILERQSDEALAVALGSLIDEHHVAVVVVGLPLSLDGSRGPAARRVEQVVEFLASKLSVPIELVDERFSSVQVRSLERARPSLRSRAKTKKAARIDDQAAALFLQAYLDGSR